MFIIVVSRWPHIK